MIDRDRARGVLLGLACGDALGRPVEGIGPDAVAAEYGTLTEMVGDGQHDAPPGTITDDTALSVALAESLCDRQMFDPVDYAERLIRWLRSDGFGRGLTTTRSIRKLEQDVPWHTAGVEARTESTATYAPGNGSVMRCAPIALAYRNDRRSRRLASKASSVITHADPTAVYGCVVTTAVVAAGFDDTVDDPLAVLDEVDRVPEALTRLRSLPRITETTEFGLTPNVVDALEIALHHGLSASSTADAIIGAVNEGGDADTTGAIAGAVAGARHGASTLPDRWLAALSETDRLCSLAETLLDTEMDAVDPATLPPLDIRDRSGVCSVCARSLAAFDDPVACPGCGTRLG